MSQHWRAGLVLDRHIAKLDLAAPGAEWRARRIFAVFGRPLFALTTTIETGQCVRQLRPDRRHLNQRYRQKPHEKDVHDEVAERHRAGEYRAAADHHDDHANHPDDGTAERRDGGDARECLSNVFKQALNARREYAILAVL